MVNAEYQTTAAYLAESQTELPSFEQVDAHVRGIDTSVFEFAPSESAPPGATAAALPDATVVLARVEAVYRAVRPILILFAGATLLPPQWRNLLQGFTAVMDALYASQDGA
jgi:hypothetical protein